MKSDFSFSYLFLSRHGIYYFRCRIPHSLRLKYKISQTEIRKSLQTTNRREAIKKAMQMWVEYYQRQFYPLQDTPMAGIPKNKYELILSMPKALANFRDHIGKFGESSKLAMLGSYISKIGDDPVVIRELMNLLTANEKESLQNVPSYQKAKLILSLNSKNFVSTHPSINHNSHKYSSDQSATLNELTCLYLEDYTTSYRQNKKTDPPQKSFTENKRALNVFAAIIGNIELNALAKEDIKKYIQISFKLPCRLNKIHGFTDLTNEEIIIKHLDKVINLPKDDYPRKSNASIKKEFSTTKKFLKWIQLEGYTNHDFHSFIKSVDVSSTTKEKPLFTASDYQLIFNSRLYVDGTHKRASDHWIPLIAIYTGCRVEEIASLYRKDIIQDSNLGLYFFNVTDDLAIKKRRKTKASKRIIPIHSQLIKLGLLDYIEKLPNNSQLFPELPPNDDGRYSVAWVNNFNRHEYEKIDGEIVYKKDGTPRLRRGLLTRCGVKKKVELHDGHIGSKSFHSFRHHFTNEVDQMEGAQRHKNFLVGHEHTKRVVSNYIHLTDDDKKAVRKLIENIRYETIDYAKIARRVKW